VVLFHIAAFLHFPLQEMLMMLLNFDDARNGSFSRILSSTHAAKETNIIRTKGEQILPLEARVHLIILESVFINILPQQHSTLKQFPFLAIISQPTDL
jgi:hypothetical protein